jgi:hypothetical protein
MNKRKNVNSTAAVKYTHTHTYETYFPSIWKTR